jgi:hypothetical protein
MTLTTDASNDTITFASSGATEQSAVFKEYLYVATSSQTTFSGSDANSETLSYTPGFLEVHLNGVKLRPTTDFTATSGSSVVLAEAASTGDIVQIGTFVQVLGFGDSVVTTATGDGSTNTVTLGSNPSSETNTQVYIDGVYQAKDKYSVSGTTLTFGSGNTPPNGATIEVVIGSRSVTTASVDSFTANGGISVDNITIDGTEIDLSSGDLTLDVAGDINLDADGGNVYFKDGGSTVAQLFNSSSDVVLKASQSNKDILFRGVDDGSEITALTLDMSASGAATFNDQITLGSGSNLVNAGNMTIDVGGDLTLDADGSQVIFKDGGTTRYTFNLDATPDLVMAGGNASITASTQDADLSFIGNDGGSDVTALTLDMSDAGTATFNHDIKLGDNGKAVFGAGDDLEIYSDGGSNNYILSNNGALILRNLSNDKDIYLQSDDGSGGFTSYLHAKGSSGEVILKHYGSNKLVTTSSGVQTTGTVNVNGAYTLPTSDGTNGQVLKTDGSGTLSFADDSDATALLVVGRSANTSVTVTTGNLTVVGRSANVSVGVS